MMDEQFWVAVSFVLFVILTYKMIANLITQILKQRTDAVTKQLEQAHNLKAEAELILSQMKIKQQTTEAEINQLLLDTAIQNENMFKEASKSLEQLFNNKQKLMLTKIENQKQVLIKEMTLDFFNKAIKATKYLLSNQIADSATFNLSNISSADLKTYFK